MARTPSILRHPGLQPLWDGLQREWKQQQYVAVALLLLGVGGLCYGAIYAALLVLLLSSLLVCVALFWLFRLSTQKPVSEVYHLFLEEADQIVWVYALVTERLPFGLSMAKSAVLYLYFADGEEISISLPASKVKLVTKTLNRVLPRAEFGYTAERELKYRGEVTTRRFSWWNQVNDL